MSILETFYVLFKTDADKAADDIEKIDDASDKAERGLKKVDAAASRLGGSFVSMARDLVAPIAALASAGTVISAVFNRIQQIGDIGDQAFKLRSTTEDYDALTRAVRAAGGEMEVAQANLVKFSDKLNDAAARPDGPNAKNFAKWGIAFKDVKGEAVGAVDGLLALAKSLEGVSQAEALGRLRRLGIDDADTIDFLLQGKAAILEKMEAEKRAGVVTDRQIELEGEYQSTLGRTMNIWDGFIGTLTEAVLPGLIRAFNTLNRLFDWATKNQTLVEGFFIGIATAVTVYFLPAMASAAAAVIAATWPFLAMAAVVGAIGTAFALAYEDVQAFMNGQPSLIGELVAKYEWFAEAVRMIGVVFGAVKDGIVAGVDAIGSAWDAVTSAIGAMWGVVQPILQGLIDGVTDYYTAWFNFLATTKPIWDAIGRFIGVVAEIAAKAFSKLSADLAALAERFGVRFEEIKATATRVFGGLYDAAKPAIDKIKEAADLIKQAFQIAFDFIATAWNNTVGAIASGIDRVTTGLQNLLNMDGSIDVTVNAASNGAAIGAMVGQGQRALNGASGAAINGATSQSIGAAGATVNQTSTVTVGSVTVNTQATDAKGVASAVRNELKNQLQDTSSHFDDGVDR